MAAPVSFNSVSFVLPDPHEVPRNRFAPWQLSVQRNLWRPL